MILAELGLLDGRRATTHWWWCPILGQRYPDVTIEPDAIFIRDGNIWTSAGVTAGMDLALALLEEDWGHDVALKVARYNVMYMMRPGGQTQFSANLIAQKAEDPRIGETLDHILANSVDDLTVASLASRAAMSERSFTRKFKEETGMTPAHYVEAARLQKARVELEQTDIPVEQIARQTGFGTAERMRRVFQRHLGISATDYRDRFRITIARTQEEHAP
jgi:transcriptional regulator GlxA family with amidase domain